MPRQYNGTTDDLLGHPLWRQVGTGIFEFIPNPDYTLGVDEGGGYSLTDGAGDVYVWSIYVGPLAAYAFAFLYPGSVVRNTGGMPYGSKCGICLNDAAGGVGVTNPGQPGVELYLCPEHTTADEMDW